MNPKKVAARFDSVVFPEDIELTYIDVEEASPRSSNADIQKILKESIKKKLDLEP